MPARVFSGQSHPRVSNRKWWLGQLSPHSPALGADHLSPSILPVRALSRLSRRTPQSSLWGTAEPNCPPTGSIIAPAFGLSGEFSALHLPLAFFLFLCTCVRKCMCVLVCVCVCAGDTHRKNSWITEARQDFWTALEQMVDELDRGIKTPEIENASVADGWDCGIVSWGLGARELSSILCFSVLFATEGNVSPSPTSYIRCRLYITGPNKISPANSCWCGNEHPHLRRSGQSDSQESST